MEVELMFFLDSLVFGGNCLHNYSTKIQNLINHLEDETNEDPKYRLEGFVKLTWCVADNIAKTLGTKNQDEKQISKLKTILEDIYLFIKKEYEKKEDKDQIPSTIKPEKFLAELKKHIYESEIPAKLGKTNKRKRNDIEKPK